MEKDFIKTLLVFALLAIVLNVDRLLLGESGTLKRTDVADMYITKFEQGAAFWKNPKDNAWDSSILRGSPIHLGSVQPQHFCSLLSIFLPVHLSFTLFQILIEFLILTGTYLFFYNFLGYRHLISVYGSLFHLSMFYWFNENPFVTQTFLSILIVAVTSIGRRPIGGFLRFFLLLTILFISFPPYTVPLAPLAHLLFLCLFSDKDKRAVNLIAWGCFWAVFTLFYLPNLIGYFFGLNQSNRILWAPGAGKLSMQSLSDSLHQMHVWFPCASVISLFYFYKVRLARWILLVYFLILLIISQSSFLVTIPILKVASFAWGRIINYSSILMLFLTVYLIEHYPVKISKRNLVGMCAWIIIGAATLKSQWISQRVALMFMMLSTLSIGYVVFNVLQYAKTPFRALILGLVFLLPFKIFYVKHYEDIPYAFLNQDRFQYDHSFLPYRVVSLCDECWHPTFYPAQAQANGQETLDGVSVFYNKMDAQNWINYVIKDTDPCSFKAWNNRVELVRATWDDNADSIVKWLRLNNTIFIRSSSEIYHQDIVLQDYKTVKFSVWSKVFSPYLLETKEHYLYRIKNPISRVFAVDASKISNKDGGLIADDLLFSSLDALLIKNITIDSYASSRITWQGTFDNQVFLVSNNYNSHWVLWIDQHPVLNAVKQGPFGMLMITPQQGSHKYSLVFKDDLHRNLWASIIIGISLLFLFIHWLKRKESSFNVAGTPHP